MHLTEPQMKTLLRRPGCENTYNLGVMMRRTFNNFYEWYDPRPAHRCCSVCQSPAGRGRIARLPARSHASSRPARL
jgi:hypothetical protein